METNRMNEPLKSLSLHAQQQQHVHVTCTCCACMRGPSDCNRVNGRSPRASHQPYSSIVAMRRGGALGNTRETPHPTTAHARRTAWHIKRAACTPGLDLVYEVAGRWPPLARVRRRAGAARGAHRPWHRQREADRRRRARRRRHRRRQLEQQVVPPWPLWSAAQS